MVPFRSSSSSLKRSLAGCAAATRVLNPARGARLAARQFAVTTSDHSGSIDVFSAISRIKSESRVKFDETVDLNVHLGLDPRKQDQQLRASAVLPRGTGKDRRVCVFAADEETAAAAKEAGAVCAGGQELVSQIEASGGKQLDFDYCIAASDAAGLAKKLGRILGPKGMMPNAKDNTVVPPGEIAAAVAAAQMGKVDYRTCKQGHVNVPIGKVSFTEEALAENLKAVLGSFFENKPAGAKGQYLRKAHLSSTMGKGYEIELKYVTPTSQWYFRQPKAGE